MTADTLGNALTTGRSLVLLQLLSRLLTFALNQSLVRLAPPEVFGTAAIQFDLIYSTILFLSREGIRHALLRAADAAGKRKRTKLETLPFDLGKAVSLLAVCAYHHYRDPVTWAQKDFHPALGLYVAAALVELYVEPLYVRALRSDPPRLSVRVQAEGGQAITKAVVTFTALIFRPDRPLLGFALGQAVGGACLAARYIWEYGRGSIYDPRAEPADPDTFKLALANTGQSVIKHVLTEGDRIVVGRVSPLGDQGGYAVAINYGKSPPTAHCLAGPQPWPDQCQTGSLIARIVFQPLEETLLLHFSRSPDPATTRQVLAYVVHLSLHLLLFLPCFVPPVLPIILPLLLPARYRDTSAASTLETYLAFYIPLLSLNGILEAFHASSATPMQIARQAKWMFASSAAFAAGLWAMTTYHVPEGMTTEQYLVMASCLSMAVRIVYAALHARRQARITLREVLPHPFTMAVAVGGAAVLRAAEGKQLLAATGVTGVIALVTLWLTEKPRFMELRRTLQDKK